MTRGPNVATTREPFSHPEVHKLQEVTPALLGTLVEENLRPDGLLCFNHRAEDANDRSTLVPQVAPGICPQASSPVVVLPRRFEEVGTSGRSTARVLIDIRWTSRPAIQEILHYANRTYVVPGNAYAGMYLLSARQMTAGIQQWERSTNRSDWVDSDEYVGPNASREHNAGLWFQRPFQSPPLKVLYPLDRLDALLVLHTDRKYQALGKYPSVELYGATAKRCSAERSNCTWPLQVRPRIANHTTALVGGVSHGSLVFVHSYD